MADRGLQKGHTQLEKQCNPHLGFGFGHQQSLSKKDGVGMWARVAFEMDGTRS